METLKKQLANVLQEVQIVSLKSSIIGRFLYIVPTIAEAEQATAAIYQTSLATPIALSDVLETYYSHVARGARQYTPDELEAAAVFGLARGWSLFFVLQHGLSLA